MAEDDLRIGILVEDLSEDQADELNTSFVMPAQAERREGDIDLVAEARIVDISNGTLRNL